MPWLDLLAKYEDDVPVAWVPLLENFTHHAAVTHTTIDGFEELGGEGADIVEV